MPTMSQNIDDYKNMKVSELRDELQSRGLSTKGLKKELMERLEQAIHGDNTVSEPSASSQHDAPPFHDLVPTESEQSPVVTPVIEKEPKLIFKPEIARSPSPSPNLQSQSSSVIQEGTGIQLPESSSQAPLLHKENAVLRISNLVRPFSYEQLLHFISAYGKIGDFWINSIKSQCFVRFIDPSDADAALNSLNNMIWPKETGKELNVSSMSFEEAADHIKQEHSGLGTGHMIGFKDVISSDDASDDKMHQQTSVQDKLSMSLNDIFKITKAEPQIYYLPADSKDRQDHREPRDHRAPHYHHHQRHHHKDRYRPYHKKDHHGDEEDEYYRSRRPHRDE